MGTSYVVYSPILISYLEEWQYYGWVYGRGATCQYTAIGGVTSTKVTESQRGNGLEFDQDSKVSHALGLILAALFIGGLVSALVMVVEGEIKVAIALSVGLLLLMVSYFFQQRGSTQVAAGTLIAILLVVATYLAFIGLGVHDLAMLLFPAAIVVASLLLGTRWFIGIAATVMALIAGIVLGEVWGIYETPFVAETGINDLVIAWIIIILTAIPVRIMSEDLRGAFVVAQRAQKRYYGVFNGAPVSLWVEDISGVLEVLGRLKEGSPEGIEVYLNNNPGAVLDIASHLTVLDVNSATVEMFEASSKDELISQYHKTFTQESIQAMKEMLVCIAAGAPSCHAQAEYVTLRGRRIQTMVSLVPASPDEGWVDQVIVSITDISDQKRLEAELSAHEHKIRRAYADVLEAVTQEKLVVKGKNEIELILGPLVGGSMPVVGFADLENMRKWLRKSIKKLFPDLEGLGAAVMATGEAITNGVKHGGSCMVQVHRLETEDTPKLQVSVKDYGPGIDFLHLPRAVLMAGFSTKTSLGMGFTIMLELCDQLLLATDDSGTTVVLEFNQPK